MAEAAQRPRRDKLAVTRISFYRLTFQQRLAGRSALRWMETDHANGGKMLLARVERRPGVADHFARAILKSPTRTRSHLLSEILRAHIFAIPCGYGDATMSIGYGSIRRRRANKTG